jgi:flagellar hook-associated protein 1 FlgK
MSIARLFEIGKRSLLAYQSAINTTTENISNANREEYSRKRVNLINIPADVSGYGVETRVAIRMRQEFAQHQIWNENQNLGRHETLEMMLSQVEGTFADNTEASISNVLSQFWSAWNDLANDPESSYARTIVRDRAMMLTNSFNRIYKELKGFKPQLTPEIRETVTNVNQIIRQISEINKQLKIASSPDLLDERDLLIKKLSKLTNIDVTEKENGEVNIFTDGLILVQDDIVNELVVHTTTVDSDTQIEIRLKDIPLSPTIRSGQLSGLLDTYNNIIPEYLDKLNTLAKGLVKQVNDVHRTGYNISGVSGVNFFDPNLTGAGDMQINDAVYDDPSLIATRAAGEGEGSSSIAQAISAIQFEQIVAGTSANDYYSSMLTELGSTIQESQFIYRSQEMIILQLQNQKEAVTGVSMDEEMTRLIQFQQAYEASARLVTTVDQMVETLLTMAI